jgi:hypothetical protein
MKEEFLVVYDYETGGAWAFILAESAEQIRDLMPELKIVTGRPPWWNAEEERLTRERLTIDINDVENPFLAAIIRGRSRAD